MKKVLIITYYWPPAGGGGVQRWLKFSKYLREFNWEPIIYTPEGGELPAIDESLLNEVPEGLKVIRTPIWEPYSWYKKFTGKKKNERVYSGFITEGPKETMTQKISIFIRGNFFIPDARKFWIRPSIKYLKRYLQNHTIDAVISTGPPHSMHRIAYGLKKTNNIPWIADFRDPWTNIDFYDQLRLTSWANRRHKRMEKEVLTKADRVVTVSWNWAEDFEKNSGAPKVEVIHNGYDPLDFLTPAMTLDEHFTICHIGSMNKDRNPHILWQVLANLNSELEGFKNKLQIQLIGKVDFSIFESIKQYGLKQNLKRMDFIPHADVVRFLQKAQLLLLPINNTPNSAGVLPGKLYEYLGAKRPILCIGPPKQDAGRVIRETRAGTINDYDDFEGLKRNLLNSYDEYRKEDLQCLSHGITKYSRKALAKKYADLLNSLTKGS